MKTQIIAQAAILFFLANCYPTNAQELRQEYLQFCKTTRNKYQKNISDRKSSQSMSFKNTSQGGGLDVGYELFNFGGNYQSSNNSGSSNSSNSEFTQN